MTRPLRPGLLDGTYHITARGVNREAIFREDADRLDYLSQLEEHARVGLVRVLAYVLMGNHVHLVLSTGDTNLSSIIQRMHGIYAARFNWKYSRTGHLFGSRFHSKDVSEDSYLLAATCYVHINPVRAGIVQHPEHYLWSSYRVYLGHEPDSFVDPNPVLNYFAANRMAAARAYAAFVLETIVRR